MVTLNTDASLYKAELIKGKTISYELENKRKPFVYVVTGTININGQKIDTNDQARISRETLLQITALNNANFLLIDVPA